MHRIFNELLQKVDIQTQSVSSRAWLREQATNLSRSPTPSSIISQSDQQTQVAPFGSLILFGYDPKTKTSLPYYDKFPLIFVSDVTSSGFNGINLHYLPHELRATLMDNLYKIGIEKNPSVTSYDFMRRVRSLRFFKPCYKRYLNSQVTTNLAVIPSIAWDIALFLPLERFSGASKNNVHRASKDIIYG